MSTNEAADLLIRQKTDENSPKRFAINVFSNVAMLVLNIVVGFWFTPYLIKHLGAALYGLVPLATSVTSYMSVIDRALNSALGRFLTIDLRQGNSELANKTFNTALWSSIGISILLLPIILGISINVPYLFDVPTGYEQQARWLFTAVMFAYLVGAITSTFRVSTFACNRFDLQNLTLVVGLLLRVAVIVLCFSLFLPQIWQVGLGLLLGGLGALLVSVINWRWLTPSLKISWRAFDRSRLRHLFSFSGWMVIAWVGGLLFLSIDLIIVNRFLGAEAGGGYGAVLQWSILLRTLASTVSSTLTPIVLAQYARGDMEQMAHLSQKAVKLLGLAIAFPVGLVCGLSESLLLVWLGAEFSHLALLMSTLTGHLSINLAILPIMSIFVALNKVRYPGIASLSMGTLNLILALWWVSSDKVGMGVALAGAVTLTLKNGIFTSLYGAHIQQLPWNTYLRSINYSLLGATSVGLSGYVLAQYMVIDSWFALGITAFLIGIIYALLLYFLVLNEEDYQLLNRFVPASIKHYK